MRATQLIVLDILKIHPRHPALHPRSIRFVFRPERRIEPRLVALDPMLEPSGPQREQREPEPRPERQREPEHEYEMPEIHRVARIAIRPIIDDPLRQRRHSGPTAGLAQPVTPDQPVLQIAPGQERQPPRHERQSSAVERKLETDHRQWTQNERLHRSAAEPAKKLVHHAVHFKEILRRHQAAVQRKSCLHDLRTHKKTDLGQARDRRTLREFQFRD